MSTERQLQDESYAWWGEFLTVRVKALHAMRRLGKTPTEMVQTLNFSDVAQAERIIEATYKDNQ